MKLLLDTQLLVWASEGEIGPGRLSREAVRLLEDRSNDLLFSAASIWEIAIKFALGRPDFQRNPMILRRLLLANGYAELAVTGDHGAAVVSLSPFHKDPFDRLLVAQAVVEGLTFVTADRTLASYGDMVRLV